MNRQSFLTWDKTPISYCVWTPNRPATRALLVFHRAHEHGARWQQTVDMLNFPDVAVFAWDQRNHGRSPGTRGQSPGITALAKDADAFARHVSAAYHIPRENTALIASSVGAVIAAAWVHDFAPPLAGMVLAAPALRVRLYVPFAIPALRLRNKLSKDAFVKSYVKSKMLTHDLEQAADYDADPMIFRQTAVNYLLDLHDTSTRLIEDAAAIHTPTLLLSAEKDWVVKLPAQKQFFDNLSSPVKEMEIFPNAYHSLFHERARPQVVARTRKFLEECFARPSSNGELLDADKEGYTKNEYDRLHGPGSASWSLIRANLKTLGRLSSGIRLGYRAGFDSGVMLDYVYENQPRGFSPLGKTIDRFYLNSIGWRGIRARRQNLQQLLRSAIQQLHRANRPVRILDIASGPARYVLETIQSCPDVPITALLRDYQQPNLDAARKLADDLRLPNITTQKADAFDRKSLAKIAPKPTIAIASGLYELFPENAPVKTSLAGIADALEDNAFLLYTCQPWHPQVEFIARTLSNREGKPWIMRRRSQAEMDALVQSAGFEKISQDIDPWGICTVSLARKLPAPAPTR